MEGVLVLIGGVLLVTPGILTDAFGFSLIIPFTRKLWAPFVRSWFGKRVTTQGSFQYSTTAGFRTQEANTSIHETEDNVTLEQTRPATSAPKFSHPKF